MLKITSHDVPSVLPARATRAGLAGPRAASLRSLQASADRSPAVQRLRALQQVREPGSLIGAGTVQRTTAQDVQDWQNNEWTPVSNLFGQAVTALNVPLGHDFNDNDELKGKMESVSAQLTGHAYEFDYGARKIADRQQVPMGPAPGLFQAGQHAQFGGGGDVSATRRGAVGGRKAVQIKGISSPNHYQVSVQLREAVEQLTGRHGEVPQPGDQRIARIVIANPNNPYPFTTPSGNTISGSTRAQVMHQFSLRTNIQLNWNYVDKIKIVFAQPQTTTDGTQINELSLSRQNLANQKVAGGLASPGFGAAPATIARPAGQFTPAQH